MDLRALRALRAAHQQCLPVSRPCDNASAALAIAIEVMTPGREELRKLAAVDRRLAATCLGKLSAADDLWKAYTAHVNTSPDFDKHTVTNHEAIVAHRVVYGLFFGKIAWDAWAMYGFFTGRSNPATWLWNVTAVLDPKTFVFLRCQDSVKAWMITAYVALKLRAVFVHVPVPVRARLRVMPAANWPSVNARRRTVRERNR